MAEITADDAKSMSCTKLTKLDCWHLVAADRGEPCSECAPRIRADRGECGHCTLKVVALVQRSRRTKKEQAPDPTPTLQPYPVVKTSPLVPTADGAINVYGTCYAGGPLRERQGYKTPKLEHRTPLVLQLLDDDGERVIDELRIVRMTGWEDVAYDWERHLGVFGFDPRRVEQVYSIRGCDVVNRIPVTPLIRANLSRWSVDALVELASRNGLIDNQSVLCDCFLLLGGGVAALAHDPEKQETYCNKLTRIVGELFRKDLAKVTVATGLLELARPVPCSDIQYSLLGGSLEKLASFRDAAGVTLPIGSVVSVIPKGGSRAAKIYAAADGTERKAVFMVTGARNTGGNCLCLDIDEHGFLVPIHILTRHTKKETSLTTGEMFQGVVHAFTPDSGAVLSERHLFNKGGSLNDHKIRDMAVTAYCYGKPWCDVLAGAGTCSSSVRNQAAVHFELASCLSEVTPEQQEEAEKLILAEPACAFMLKALPVGHAAAMKELGLKVSKGCGVGKGRSAAVVWRHVGETEWSEPCDSCFAAAMEMRLCTLADGNNCTAAQVVGALRRKVEYPGPLYRDVAAKFEVQGANDDDDDDDEEEAFVMPKPGSERVRRAAAAWTGAVQELSGRGSSGGRGPTNPYGRGDTPTAADLGAGIVGPTGSGGRGRGRGRDRGDEGDGQPPPPPPPGPGPAPAPAPGPKKKKPRTSGRYCS